jgi:predicted SprT family Zn-dependent metalloprotease
MRLEDARKIFREEMTKHGLMSWQLEIVNLKTVAGWCKTRRWSEDPRLSFGTIAMSIPFMEVFDEKEVRETARHEVAHALNNPKNDAHGAEWRKIARRIGSTGERCVSLDAPKVQSRYTGTCPQGHEYARHRKSWDMEINSRYCPRCWNQYKDKNRAYLVWFDNHTRRTLNSVAPVQKTLDTSAPVRIAAQKAPAPVRRTSPAPAKELSWKEKFDRGMTSFDDEW